MCDGLARSTTAARPGQGALRRLTIRAAVDLSERLLSRVRFDIPQAQRLGRGPLPRWRSDEQLVEPVDGLGMDGTCLKHSNTHVANRGLGPGLQLEASPECCWARRLA